MVEQEWNLGHQLLKLNKIPDLILNQYYPYRTNYKLPELTFC